MGDTKTIRPFALKGHGSIAHSASPHGLLTRSPKGQRVLLLNSNYNDSDNDNDNDNDNDSDNDNSNDNDNDDDNYYTFR